MGSEIKNANAAISSEYVEWNIADEQPKWDWIRTEIALSIVKNEAH